MQQPEIFLSSFPYGCIPNIRLTRELAREAVGVILALSNATLSHSLLTAPLSKNDDKERVMVEAIVRLFSHTLFYIFLLNPFFSYSLIALKFVSSTSIHIFLLPFLERYSIAFPSNISPYPIF